MSRFWEKILRFQPVFDGPEAEIIANIDSHTWKELRFQDEYPELSHMRHLPSVMRCVVCKTLAEGNGATWPCGEAPDSVTLQEWDDARKES